MRYCWLVLSVLCVAVMMAGNLLKVRMKSFYVIIGLVLWYTMLNSGIHSTIAGVIVAFCIPATLKKGTGHYLERIRTNVLMTDIIQLYGQTIRYIRLKASNRLQTR